MIDPRKEKDGDTVESVIPIAGDLKDAGGKAFDWKATRIGTADSTDAKRGVRLELSGGMYEHREQRAVVEFMCSDKTGLEGEWESEDKYEPGTPDSQKRDEAGGDVGYPEKQLKKDDAALIWESHGPSKEDANIDVLHLTWYTEHACYTASGGGDSSSSGHWGFFTWMIVM
jgi:hypothetical protein